MTKTHNQKAAKIIKNNILLKEKYTFIQIWDILTAKERRIMESIAIEEKAELYSKDFLTRYKLGTASQIQRSVKKLIQSDIIERSEKHFRVIDPIFALWIKETSK